jgi:hypothetical protein
MQTHVVNAWREFGKFLVLKYNDGFQDHPTIASPIGYPIWWLQSLCLDSDVHPKWSTTTPHPPTSYYCLVQAPSSSSTLQSTSYSSAAMCDALHGTCREARHLQPRYFSEGG